MLAVAAKSILSISLSSPSISESSRFEFVSVLSDYLYFRLLIYIHVPVKNQFRVKKFKSAKRPAGVLPVDNSI